MNNMRFKHDTALSAYNLIKEYAQGDREFIEWMLDVDSICINRWSGSMWDLPRSINWYRLYHTGITPSQAVFDVLDEYELKGGY